MATAVVEPYNAVLATHQTMEHGAVTFLMDNEAVFNICRCAKSLDFKKNN